MALTVTYGKRSRTKDSKIAYAFNLAFDSSYPSGGEAVTGWDGNEVLAVNIEKSGVYDFLYDHVNKKVVAFDTGTGAEVAGLTDLAALTAVRGELILRQ